MKIISLILKLLPEHLDGTRCALAGIPGVSVAHQASDEQGGRLIVLVEDQPGRSTADTIIQVHLLPHVMSVTLAYEYSDEGNPLSPDTPLNSPFNQPAPGACPSAPSLETLA